ncbi:hypothetical protein [Natronorubrum texcoconense]|uniref:Uncharacterized protein n=1 Tax=Natronorubrum texcoconense TaxID=1095776 RepID=A0A1G8WS94_9EURY|nr:hypothetical protein [Natronorubrum texcoconense]SDJ80917.1 hypothetical protein SAMN04515672_1486 [Natronorubrum texcoconense]
MSRSSKLTPRSGDETDNGTSHQLNDVEAAAQEKVAAKTEAGKAIHDENPMLCPPVCLGYGAGAFATGYLATKEVANGAQQSLAIRDMAERDVTADASIDELLEARTDD